MWGYNQIQQRNARVAAAERDSVGKRIDASAAERPGWVTSDTRFSNYCSEDASGIACVGVSSYVDNLEDARTEAQEAALEGIADAVGMRIQDPAWARSVGSIYGDVRQAKLSAFEKARNDPDSAKYDAARRDVREGRRAVAASLKDTSGGLAPTQAAAEYWEQYQSAEGTGSRFLVFTRYAVPAKTVDRLVDNYGEPEEVLGAKAVTVFPGIAWRFPDISTGAVVTTLSDGDLKAIGLAEKYIVTHVQDRQIKDAKTFAEIIGEEVARKKQEGGNLKLIVKTGDTLPVEFNKPIPKKITDTPRSPSRGGGVRQPVYNPMNIWDKTGGGKRGNRDDPTQ